MSEDIELLILCYKNLSVPPPPPCLCSITTTIRRPSACAERTNCRHWSKFYVLLVQKQCCANWIATVWLKNCQLPLQNSWFYSRKMIINWKHFYTNIILKRHVRAVSYVIVNVKSSVKYMLAVLMMFQILHNLPTTTSQPSPTTGLP